MENSKSDNFMVLSNRAILTLDCQKATSPLACLLLYKI